ncbi:MAG: GTP 3',8-cyclase MoaA [Saprospiraceae bacterium]|nr:GTP 3',8-cyclase MoaA [Saprospiraceae bacterium]
MVEKNNHKEVLIDNHGRRINYLRLAVTDRCNLRCFYCMPEEGIKYVDRLDLMTYEEMLRLIRILAEMGVNKLRITGGEPFVRKGLKGFIEKIHATPGMEDIRLTTNGTVSQSLIKDFRRMGIRGVNLSLDTLDKERFFAITRRDVLPGVLESLQALQDAGIPTKVNTVVMAGRNTADIISLAELAREQVQEVRFIEEMPFNGGASRPDPENWDHLRILSHLMENYPGMTPEPVSFGDTAVRYQVPGFKGKLGIIAAYSRTFCGSCNRLRLTPTGTVKTCLYDSGVFNIRDLMRQGATDEQVGIAIRDAVGHRARNGFEAEKNQQFHGPARESMSTIGG